ncbi:Dihydroorotase [Clavibacter michiganensis]|nr:Dihydroorotase [Clavibacter michiganensis]
MTQNDTIHDDAHLIRGATLPSGERADILVADGLIREIGPDLVAPDGAHVIEADGLVALPGLVDLHVHLREPGYEQSETVLTGSRAAALGGFTAVFAMANTMPVQDTAGVVEQVKALGDAAGYATVRPIGAVSVGLAGESMAEIGAMAASRAAVRVFSDDGKCVSDPLLMRRALEYVKAFDGVIAQHAQDPRLTEGATMNEGALSGELGITGWPAVAEESIIARDVLLAEHVGSRLHVCHVSTAGSVDVIRWAKARGVDVTAEVTPHHLLLTEDLVAGYDARYKVNPPLRRREDVEALRAALADGTIDVVATDHAPHPTEAKDCEWDAAAFGMVGLESALSVVQLAMVDTGLLDWQGVARVMSHAPARIGRLAEHGHALEAGSPADITLYDPSASRVFGRDDLGGLSGNSPYLEMTLPGRVVATLHRGYPTVLDGALVDREQVARAAALAADAPSITGSASSAQASTMSASDDTGTPGAAPVPHPDQPFVGVLFYVSGGRDRACTASVVDTPSGDAIATAAHCLVDRRTGAATTLATFIPGAQGATAPHGIWPVRVAAVSSSWTTTGRASDDAGFARVTGPAGEVLAASVGAAEPVFGTPLVPATGQAPRLAILGYPKAGSVSSTLEACAGRPQHDTGGQTSLPCALGTGAAGSPVLTAAGEQRSVVARPSAGRGVLLVTWGAEAQRALSSLQGR